MSSRSDAAIRVEGLSKRYVLGQRESYRTLRDVVAKTIAAPINRALGRTAPRVKTKEFWALDDVSFEVGRGEVLGVIGRNGAGKSTLLKLLTRITEPTGGRIEMHGRCGSLLEVGTGFHPELTGRENIYLNGAILGMRRSEIDRKFDEIVEFSEISKFLDTPVKRYSSGMYVRLAFAVAAHLEPEILIVDEVLAVGDVAFQKKCLGKMGDAASSGATVLLVSHQMAAIESLCERAILLEQGHLVAAGPTEDVVATYLEVATTVASQDLAGRTDRQGNGRLRFQSISYVLGDGRPSELVQSGQDVEFVVRYSAEEDLRNVNTSIGVYSQSGQCLIMLDSDMAGSAFGTIPCDGLFTCRVNRLPLSPGQYYLNLYCTSSGEIVDWVQNAAPLNVAAGDFFGTGKLPGPGHGGLLVLQEWGCLEDEALRTGISR